MMTNAMNEVHGRIQARQRQRARGGRHWMAQMAANVLGESHGIRSHELSTPIHSEAFLFVMFKAARAKGLDVRLEGNRDGATLSVLATDVDFASLKLAAYEEAGE